MQPDNQWKIVHFFQNSPEALVDHILRSDLSASSTYNNSTTVYFLAGYELDVNTLLQRVPSKGYGFVMITQPINIRSCQFPGVW